MQNPSELAEVPHVPPAAGADSPALVIGELYERHERMIRALCRLLLRDDVEAEDAAQQTFLSAYAGLINGTVPERPTAWLATIARRECWSRLAQRRNQPLLLDDADLPQGEARDALEDALRNADFSALWAAVNALPRQQRAAFLLRECSGLSYGQMAEALGATESAIESLLVRARRQLRDGLEPTLRATNLALTPLLLLRHRLLRLLGGNLGSGGAAAGSAPLVAQVGSAVAAVVVVSGSVGVGVHALHSGSAQARPVPAAQKALAAASGGTVFMGIPRPPEDQLLAMLAAPGGPLAALDPASPLLGEAVLGEPLPGETAAGTPVAETAAADAGGAAAGPASDSTPAAADVTAAPDGHSAEGHTAEPSTAGAPGTDSPADAPAASADAPPADVTPADTTPTTDAPIEPPPPDSSQPSDPLPPDPTTP
jgi:RNA polymerase sigma-70 factor (ECF subfamily)